MYLLHCLAEIITTKDLKRVRIGGRSEKNTCATTLTQKYRGISNDYFYCIV